MMHNKIFKRILSILLAVMLSLACVMTAVPVNARAADEETTETPVEVKDEVKTEEPATEETTEPEENTEAPGTPEDGDKTSDPQGAEPVEGEEPGDGESQETENPEELLDEETVEEPEEVGPVTRSFTRVAPFGPPVVGKRIPMKTLLNKLAANRDSNEDKGVKLEKNATAIDEDTYKITLEAWATGEKIITDVTKSTPTDIVVVLDLSGSMITNDFPNGEYHYSLFNRNHNKRAYELYNRRNDLWYQDSDGEYHKVSAVKSTSGQNSTYKFTYTVDGTTYTIGTWSHNDYPDVLFYTRSVTTESRRAALDRSFDGFIASVGKNAQGAEGTDDDVNHKVALVSFGDSAEVLSDFVDMTDPANVSHLQNITLTPDGTTHIESGIAEAVTLMNNNPVPAGETRNRVVVVFTDGIPGESSYWGPASSRVANSALGYADTLKNSGVTVYTIGIFSGADATSAGTAYTSSTSASNAAQSAPYANYFMQHLSSNNGMPQSPSFYLSAADSDSLLRIFNTIAQHMETGGATSTTINESTVIKDIVSPHFKVPANATDISIQTADYIGENQWGTPTGVAGVTPTISGDTVSVTGFNFSENWVGKTTTTDSSGTTTTYHGKKLIITFNVDMGENFLGGSDVQTNAPGSGIYLDPNGEPLDMFPFPHVDVPVKKLLPVVHDTNIYLTTEDDLGDLFNKVDRVFMVQNHDGSHSHTATFAQLFDGENNEDVSVSFKFLDSDGVPAAVFTIPHGATSGAWEGGTMPILHGDSYVVECEVDDAGSAHEEPSIYDCDAVVNIYKPVITFEDDAVIYRDAYNVSGKTPVSVVWMNGSRVAGDGVVMDTEEPVLTYSFSVPEGSISGGRVNVTDDFFVSLTGIGVQGHVYDDINLLDYNTATLKRNCTDENLDGAAASAAQAYKVHVRTNTLTVTKHVTGLFGNLSADYSFTVTITPEEGTGAAPITQTFTLKNNQSRVWRNLPRGTYTVKETGSEDYNVYFSVNGGAAEEVANREKTDTLVESSTVVVTNEKNYIPTTGISAAIAGAGTITGIIGMLGFAVICYRIYKKRTVHVR